MYASAFIDIDGSFRCGVNYNNDICPSSLCCSQYGYCGNTADYCSIGSGCQSNCIIETLETYDHCNSDKQIALSFDDGPSDYTLTLLNYLNSINVKAVFFVIGQNMTTKMQNIVKQVSRSGHDIGIHTWTHPYLTQLTDIQVKDEITKTAKLIRKITGKVPKYFRPPYLDYDKRIDTIVKSFGYTTIMVNLDSFDWKYQDTNPQMIYTNFELALTNNTKSYIDLMHDRLLVSVNMMPQIVSLITKNNYTIVSMKTCIGK